MEKFIQLLKKIFILPPLPMLIIALFGYTLIIIVATIPIEIDAIRYLLYFSSAYALIITITGFPHLKRFIKKVRRYVEAHLFMKRFKSTKIGSRFLDDVRFRTEISLYQGLLINTLYIAMKMFSGIYYRSVWFIALAFYYILLVVMRVMLLRKGKKEPRAYDRRTVALS